MKSNVSDCLEILRRIYIDACAKCTADVSDLRDLKTIESRVKEEGISFLTIMLPRFCRDFERSLSDGAIDSTAFQNFRKAGRYPSFLKGIVSQLFNYETGRLNDHEEEHVTLIESVRQICLTFKKLNIECSPERTALAFRSFSSIEREIEMFSVSLELQREFSLVSSVLWSACVADIRLHELKPRHGPGTTAERFLSNRKYVWRRWHDRLEPFLPLIDNAYSISAIDSRELKNVTIVPEADEQPVRVVAVPKTLKSPRIIAIEPACMQYAQQAVRSVLYQAIETSRFAKGHVNFRDQSVNQKLAMRSSFDNRYATIDLSDASDRVPLDLATIMFESHPDLKDMILACRSTSASLPSGEIISPLKKFASMGSALCFPVESMYFYTICVAALLNARNLPVSPANVFKVSREIYVYGDDIVVPTTNAVTVLDYLQKYNCKVNTAKTFYRGSFRESCGVDAYAGGDVTPLYARRFLPKNKQESHEIISCVMTANSFYLKGYWHTASYLFSRLECIVGPLPYVGAECSGIGRISLLGYRSVERWNNKLQRQELKTLVPTSVYRSDKIGGYSALEKSFHRLEDMKTLPSDEDLSLKEFVSVHDGLLRVTVSDPLHLERSALRGTVALKYRWVPTQ